MITVFFPIIQLACLAHLYSSASAFTLPASSLAPLTSSWNNVDLDLTSSPSTVVLFAKAAKKKKPKKSARSNTGAGAGFGSTQRVVSRQGLAAKEEELVQLGSAAKVRQERHQKVKQRYESTATSSKLTAIYTDEFQQQELFKKASLPRRLVQVSQSPLIFTIDEFIDPAACAQVQSNGAGCFNLLFPELLSDLLFNGQESEMDGLLFNEASSQDHNNKNGAYPDGLHMDTNNQCMERHVTAILYLNDVPEECGGATVFPLARTLPDDPALTASQRLLAKKKSHTRTKEVLREGGLGADARLIETRRGTNFEKDPNTETAIRIQPKAGRVLLFFSRHSNGEEDPRTWHSGERILDSRSSESESSSATKKRILTLFKEVDYAETDCTQPSRTGSTFESYLAPQIHEQREWLKEKSKLSLL